MFTKSQLVAAAAVVASASSVMAAPIQGEVTELEARHGHGHYRASAEQLERRLIMEYLQDLEARGPKKNPQQPQQPEQYGKTDASGQGWITPAAGSGAKGKARQTSEVLAVQAHANNEPHHPAVAQGNKAVVHDTFHSTQGGANHATVKYQNPGGQHVSTLHLAKDGTRLVGDQAVPAHRGGGSPPPNTPASSTGSPNRSRSGSPSSQKSGKRGLEDILAEFQERAVEEYLEARGPKKNPQQSQQPEQYGKTDASGQGWITPAAGSGAKGKARQTSEVLAVQAHANSEPHHPAVASGNKAVVHDTFHSTHGGANHATVKYQNPGGQHVSTLHLAKDGTRLVGDQAAPAHRGGGSPPPNTPASSTGSPNRSRSGSPSSQKSGKRDLEFVEAVLEELQRRGVLDYLEDLEARGPKNPQQPQQPEQYSKTDGSGQGWITPTAGSGAKGKTRQKSEILAAQAHANNDPAHPAVAQGNKAIVHDSFHSTQGGANHATVKHQTPSGQHSSTLHIAKDGTRLVDDQAAPAHRGGGSPPANSPASNNGSPNRSRSGSPSSQKSGKRDLELAELIAREFGLYDDLD